MSPPAGPTNDPISPHTPPPPSPSKFFTAAEHLQRQRDRLGLLALPPNQQLSLSKNIRRGHIRNNTQLNEPYNHAQSISVSTYTASYSDPETLTPDASSSEPYSTHDTPVSPNSTLQSNVLIPHSASLALRPRLSASEQTQPQQDRLNAPSSSYTTIRSPQEGTWTISQYMPGPRAEHNLGTFPHEQGDPLRAHTNPQQPPTMTFATPPHWSDTPSRNVSLDSGVSSLSSSASGVPSALSAPAPNSHNASIDSSTARASTGPRDARSYIATTAAGDPILAVEKLLKEKEALWAFVQRQRTTLKDLDESLKKAIKDRDRYRKRLKDNQEAVPLVPHNLATTYEALPERAPQKTYPSQGNLASVNSSVRSIANGLNGPEHINASNQQESSNQQPQASAAAAIGIAQNSQSNHSTTAVSPPSSAAQITRTAGPRDLESTRQIALHNNSSPSSTQQLRQQVSSPGEKSRKPAPAPLDLSQANSPTYQPALTPASVNSGSDYGDGASTDRNTDDRGRRRTRQDDDREREELAMIEEARSRSNKSSKSSKGKSKNTFEDGTDELAVEPLSKAAPPAPFSNINDTVLPPTRAIGVGLPSSPRAALGGGMQSPLAPSVGSIASALAPPKTTFATYPEAQQAAALPKSPGLPLSPRPGDRPVNAPLPRMPAKEFAAPGPISPRQGMPLSPRAPRNPIPVPSSASTPNFPTSTRSPPTDTGNSSMAERLQPGYHRLTPQDNSTAPTQRTDLGSDRIHSGLASATYPSLPLHPTVLPQLSIKVYSSRLRPPRSHGSHPRYVEDEAILTLAVLSGSLSKQLWRLEKRPVDLASLDEALRRQTKIAVTLSDRKLFSGHSPAKLDARRAAINNYFDVIIKSPLKETAAQVLCKFLSSNIIEAHAEQSPISPTEADMHFDEASPMKQSFRKEGYLGKKGDWYGGWKSQYFVLEDAQLTYSEVLHSDQLGLIKLQNAQILRPNSKDVVKDAEFRHAFTILERKRSDSTSGTSHVLCAESDDERNAWVDALLHHVSGERNFGTPPSSPKTVRTSSFNTTRVPQSPGQKQRNQGSIDSDVTPQLKSWSYNDTTAAQAPKFGATSRSNALAPSPMDSHSPSATPTSHLMISGPKSGGPIQNPHAWGNKGHSPTRTKERELKKRSVFGFKRSSDEPATPSSRHGGGRGSSPRPPERQERRPVRAVFGVPLAEAAEYAQMSGANSCLPTPVYRCIEYLEAKNAVKEIGLFRQSGSKNTINQLRDRFDTEGDVDLLNGSYVDVHAVACLLKEYLRELPEQVLTRGLSASFAKLHRKSGCMLL